MTRTVIICSCIFALLVDLVIFFFKRSWLSAPKKKRSKHAKSTNWTSFTRSRQISVEHFCIFPIYNRQIDFFHITNSMYVFLLHNLHCKLTVGPFVACTNMQMPTIYASFCLALKNKSGRFVPFVCFDCDRVSVIKISHPPFRDRRWHWNMYHIKVAK